MTIFEIETFTQRTGCLSFKIETTSVADPGLQIRWRPGHQDPDIRRRGLQKYFFSALCASVWFKNKVGGGWGGGGDLLLLIIVLVSCHNGGISLGF